MFVTGLFARILRVVVLTSTASDSKIAVGQNEENRNLVEAADKSEPLSKADKLLADLQNELVRC